MIWSISSTTFTSGHLCMTCIKSLHVNFLYFTIILILLFWQIYFGIGLFFLIGSFFITFSSLSWSSVIIFKQIIIIRSVHHFIKNQIVSMKFRDWWIEFCLSFRLLCIRNWSELVTKYLLWFKLTRSWWFHWRSIRRLIWIVIDGCIWTG